MKRIITIICSILSIILTIIFIEPITNKLANYISENPQLVINEGNEYTKKHNYLFVQLSKNYIPYSYQDLLNIFYSVINNRWENFTFYCPSEYKNCLEDTEKITSDELLLPHLNNYVHPFNNFSKINTTLSESGEITISVSYIYAADKINKIIKKVDEVINQQIKDDMDSYEKIKVIHDYIGNTVKYDVTRNEDNTSNYESYTAYGPLFEGYATCNGYTDLMAIFLSRLNFNNYKIATTPDEISYKATGHVWNAVNIDDKWLHLDLTWDDPVASDKRDYLFHTYFLVTTEEMKEADKGKTTIEEHNFNSLYYLEFN